MPTLRICIAQVGNADKSFSENSGKPKKLGTLIYGPQFRVLSGGSKWLSALPTGSKWLSAQPTGSKWVQAQPARPTGSAAAGRHVFPEPRYSNGL